MIGYIVCVIAGAVEKCTLKQESKEQQEDLVEEPQCKMNEGDTETPEECITDPYRQGITCAASLIIVQELIFLGMVDFGVCDGNTMSSFGQEIGAAVSRYQQIWFTFPNNLKER